MGITEILIYALWLVSCIAFGYYNADAIDHFVRKIRDKFL